MQRVLLIVKLAICSYDGMTQAVEKYISFGNHFPFS